MRTPSPHALAAVGALAVVVIGALGAPARRWGAPTLCEDERRGAAALDRLVDRTWERDERSLLLRSDGTCAVDGVACSWRAQPVEVTGGLVLTLDDGRLVELQCSADSGYEALRSRASLRFDEGPYSWWDASR